MSASKFKFVSPGIFLNEIDNSQLPSPVGGTGPVIIGRTERGPAMRPVKVNSFAEFVEMFGNPVPGGRGDDVWREGNYLGPTYAAYAAQAWLANGSSATIVRLLGVEDPDQNAGQRAGWACPPTARPAAYGLFIADAPAEAEPSTLTLTVNPFPVAGNEGLLGLQVDCDATGVADDATLDVTAGNLLETSAQRQAIKIDCIGLFARIQDGGGGGSNETLTLSTGGGTAPDGSAVAAFSHSILVGDGAGVHVDSAGSNTAQLCTDLVNHINTNLSDDLFAATATGTGGAGTAVQINLQTPGTGGGLLLTATTADTGGKGGAAFLQPCDNNLGGAVSFGALAHDGPAAGVRSRNSCLTGAAVASGAACQNDGLLSIRAACETAGIDPTALGAGNIAVATAIAAQIRAAIQAQAATLAALGGAAPGNGHNTVLTPTADNTVVLTKSAAQATSGLNVNRMNSGSLRAGAGSGDAWAAAATVEAFGGASMMSGDFGDAALAAVIYHQGDQNQMGHIVLEGDTLVSNRTRSQAGIWVKSCGPSYEFKMRVRNQLRGAGAEDTTQELVNFNFDPASKKYIRKVLNTNPTLTNGNIIDNGSAVGLAGGNIKSYWLGQTFDRHLLETLSLNSAAGLQTVQTTPVAVAAGQANAEAAVDGERLQNEGAGSTGRNRQVACLVELLQVAAVNNTTVDVANHSDQARPPRSGWVISQHMGKPSDFLLDGNGDYPDTAKLFRFHGLYSGEWDQKNLKISIEDIKPSPNPDAYAYGSFTVSVRKSNDTDKNPTYVERYTNVNLDPASTNYIGVRIGDMETFWGGLAGGSVENRYRTVGQYENKSKFLRVEVNDDLAAGLLDPSLLPFGFYGPPKLADVTAQAATADMWASGRNDLPSSAGRISACVVQGVRADAASGAPLSGFAQRGNGVATADDTETSGTIVPGFLGDSNDLVDNPLAAKDNGLYFDATGDAQVVLRFPKMLLRKNTREGDLTRARDCYWGIQSLGNAASVNARVQRSSTKSDTGYGDYVSSISAQVGALDRATISAAGADEIFAPAFVFTLDNVQMEHAHGRTGYGSPAAAAAGQNQGWDSTLAGAPANRNWDAAPSTTHAEYLDENHDGIGGTAVNRLRRGAASARRMGSSLSSLVDVNGEPTVTYANTLASGFDRFTMPLYGGQDGLDIREKEPFRNTGIAGRTALNHYAYASIRRAIDAVSDPEVVECNIMAMPGITEPTLTDHLVRTCEARADALAVIDLEDDYVPNTENTTPERQRLPNVDRAILSLRDRVLSSSYGCAYYPWVQVKDQINNALVWVPPSVVALGTMSSNDKAKAPWFAPAGFTRGGLSNGAAGLPVTNVRHKLNSEERDKLYDANINPIASFPAEGIVVFGQKTLQAEASALDRINVRRLMIFVKKEISKMAATVLFDQNVQATWSRFTSMVEPFLDTVQAQFGLTAYRVVLDETTTTADLIDRNIMYAKIMLKPARAIEFIAIDFVITNTGASFDD